MQAFVKCWSLGSSTCHGVEQVAPKIVGSHIGQGHFKLDLLLARVVCDDIFLHSTVLHPVQYYDVKQQQALIQSLVLQKKLPRLQLQKAVYPHTNSICT